MGDHSAGSDGVEHHTHAHHALHVMVFSSPQEELHAHVVGTFIDHEAAALHPARLAPAQVGGNVRAVAEALIGATLEVSLLVEDDLKQCKRKIKITNYVCGEKVNGFLL